MSIINRNNYEIYFLDYLEGNLSPELKQEMDLFLIKNPDLKEELEGLDDAILPDEKIVFSAKQSLKNLSMPKRPERFLSDDEFLVAKIEGDLTAKEEIAFESYINGNPLLEKEYSLFKLTKLQPDPYIVFEHKSSLKRLEIPSGYHTLRNYSYAAASVAAVLLFIAFFFFDKEESPITPQNSNYLSLVHPTTRNHDNDIPENKITFAGSPKTNEQEEKVINMEIKIQKNLNANLNNNQTANDESLKKTELPQNDKVIIDENFNPANLHNLQKQDQVDINKVQDKVVQNNNSAPDKQKVNQPMPAQKMKKTNNNNDNGNLTFLKVVSMGLRGLSNLTGSKMELKQQYDAKGNVKSLAFNSSNVEISAPVKKK